MARHTHGGHVWFSMGLDDRTRPSQIRRRQKNAGRSYYCIYCGEPQMNGDAVTIHQKLCEYKDDAKRAELLARRAKQRRRERIFDALYDLGYSLKTSARRALCGLHLLPTPTATPVRGPEPIYPNINQKLLDSVAAKYGRPRHESR